MNGPQMLPTCDRHRRRVDFVSNVGGYWPVCWPCCMEKSASMLLARMMCTAIEQMQTRS